jgi:hypothetical protein
MYKNLLVCSLKWFGISIDEAKKWIVSVLVLVAAIYLLQNRGTLSWIDNADLIFHEAGHFFFILFGRFIYTLGGTLMQIIIPLMIFSYFLSNEYRTGAQISLLWLGQNFINISVYAADARSKKLPLLGGYNVYHDWNYMLGELGLLQYDTEVGYFWVALALVSFLMSVLMPLIIRN